MGFLICDKCKGYYELNEDESAEDFDSKCTCGGNLLYMDFLGEDLDPNNPEKAALKKFRGKKFYGPKKTSRIGTETKLLLIGAIIFIILILGFFILMAYNWMNSNFSP